MNTDYQNMNFFDTSAVFFAAAGILLIGVITFLSFPEKQQKNIVVAIGILDMSQEVEKQQQNFLAIFQTTDNFSKAVFVSFNEVVAMPDEFLFLESQTKLAIEKLGEYSEYIIRDNNSQTEVSEINIQRGEILGAYIDNSINTVANQIEKNNQAKIQNEKMNNIKSSYSLISQDKQTYKKYLPNLLINY
jgi:hypothetical protein